MSLHKSLKTYFSDFEPDWRKIDIHRWQKRFSYNNFYKRDIEKGNPHLPDNLCVFHREKKTAKALVAVMRYYLRDLRDSISEISEIVSQRSQRYLWGVAVRGSWACKASQCWPWCVCPALSVGWFWTLRLIRDIVTSIFILPITVCSRCSNRQQSQPWCVSAFSVEEVSHSVHFMPTKPWCVHLLDTKLRIWGVAERGEAAK